ncbi:MAG: sigma-70 family RNA polymerase sigma factor [Ruminococcus sp.]|nr:sigma-70 family RNA polymerase sigma factor [Ruminococcus sp.]
MNMDDRELLEQMKSGDEGALEAVMKKYRRLVEYIAGRMISSEDDREETVMDTFYKVWAARDRIDPDRMSLKSYISMTASGCTVDKLRRITKGAQVDPLEDDLELDLDLENEASRSINLDIIKSCIREMPSPDREIFIDRYYFELDVKEISRRRGVKEKKIWNILSRRKDALKKALIKGGIIL